MAQVAITAAVEYVSSWLSKLILAFIERRLARVACAAA